MTATFLLQENNRAPGLFLFLQRVVSVPWLWRRSWHAVSRSAPCAGGSCTSGRNCAGRCGVSTAGSDSSTQSSRSGRLQTLHVETSHPLWLLGMLGILAARGSCWAGEVGIPRSGRQPGHGGRPGSCGLAPCSIPTVPAGSPVPAVQLQASWSNLPRAGDSWRSQQGEEPGCWKRIWQASALRLLNASGAGGEERGSAFPLFPAPWGEDAGTRAGCHGAPLLLSPQKDKTKVSGWGHSHGCWQEGARASTAVAKPPESPPVPGLWVPLGLVSDLSPFPGRDENK